MGFHVRMIREVLAEAGRDDRADEQTAAAVEAVMRATFTALDWMTEGEFRVHVWSALAEVELMHTDGFLDFWCEQADVTVPAWAAESATVRIPGRDLELGDVVVFLGNQHRINRLAPYTGRLADVVGEGARLAWSGAWSMTVPADQMVTILRRQRSGAAE